MKAKPAKPTATATVRKIPTYTAIPRPRNESNLDINRGKYVFESINHFSTGFGIFDSQCPLRTRLRYACLISLFFWLSPPPRPLHCWNLSRHRHAGSGINRRRSLLRLLPADKCNRRSFKSCGARRLKMRSRLSGESMSQPERGLLVTICQHRLLNEYLVSGEQFEFLQTRSL